MLWRQDASWGACIEELLLALYLFFFFFLRILLNGFNFLIRKTGGEKFFPTGYGMGQNNLGQKDSNQERAVFAMLKHKAGFSENPTK